VHWAPGIPRALFNEGDEIFRQTSGAICVASAILFLLFEI
jgi:hypothetical protein